MMNRTNAAFAIAIAAALAALAIAAAIGASLLFAGPAHASTQGATVLAAARSKLGDVYSQANPQGPNHWDCSGLTRYSFGKAGIKLPRVAQDQYNATVRVAPANRQVGDLILIGSPNHITHAGIFAGVRGGKGYMVNANTGSYRGRKVVEAPVTEYTAGSPRAYYGRKLK
jgi:cell wall-associated NlpC family hydrolase